jgi:AcrR family transcriptional regulator
MVVVKDKVRAEIINVARKIFTSQGFKKTTMEDVARASGKGKSSIYYYFKSKEEIFEAVVEKEAEELKIALEKVIQSGKDPMERLKGYIMFRLYHARTVSNFYSALKEKSLNQMHFVEGVRKNFEEQEFHMVAEILETGIKEGAFKINNSKIGSIAITTMLKGLELPLFLNEYTRAEKEKLLDDLIRILFYGLIKR